MIFHLHAAALPGGFIGVDVFFVISGFVVTRSMLRDVDLPAASFLAAFYSRRFRRIVPALFVCLVVTVLVSEAVVPLAWLSQTMQKAGRAAFVGASNFVLSFQDDGYFATRSTFNPFTHTWSLAVEEQFYLLFPLILFFCLRLSKAGSENQAKRTVVVPIAVVISLSVLSLIYCALVTAGQPSIAYYMLPSRFWELGTGSVLAISFENITRPRGRLTSEALAVVGLLLIAISLLYAREDAFPFPWAIPVVTGSAILIFLAASQQRNATLSLFASRPFALVGLLSYSLYLWHWPVFTLMRWTCGLDTPATWTTALVITAVLAWGSYHFVEQGVQRSVLVNRQNNCQVVFAGIAVSFGGALLAAGIYSMPNVFSLTTVQRHHQDWYPDFVANEVVAGACRVKVERLAAGHVALIPYGCPLPASASAGQLYVLGDSHADAYNRMLQLYVAHSGVRTDIFAMGGCPWAPIFQDSSAQTPACVMFKAKTLAEVTTSAPPHSVVFLASLRVPRLSDQFGLTQAQEAELARYRRTKALPGVADARTLLGSLRRASLAIIMDAPKPVLRAPPYRCSDWFNRNNPICRGGLDVPRAAMVALREPVLSAMQAMASQNSAKIWDPFVTLCPPGPMCSATRDGRPLFFDGDHLSGYANEILLDSFNRSVQLALETQRMAQR